MERDGDTDAQLQAAGWTVLRFWEHEPADLCASVVCTTVAARRSHSTALPPDACDR
jgi:DNA mismatch endonuclease (patch repair protein)